MSIALPDISSVPPTLLAKGNDALAAGMALAILGRPGAESLRVPAGALSRMPLEQAALSYALSDWADGLNKRLGLFKFRLHVLTGQAIGEEGSSADNGNVTIFVGHESGDYIDSFWTLERRWKSIESRAPGLASSALHVLQNVRACPILAPWTAVGFCQGIHWMGEIDETFIVEEYHANEFPDEDGAKLTKERREQLAEEIGIPTVANLNRALPTFVQRPKMLGRRKLEALARRRGEIADIAKATLALIDTELASKKKGVSDFRGYEFDCEGVLAMGYSTALRWSHTDPMFDLFDQCVEHHCNCSQSVEPAWYWHAIHADAIGEWMRAMERSIPSFEAAERLLPMIAIRSKNGAN